MTNCRDNPMLNIESRKNELATHAVAKFIGQPLSPFHAYLGYSSIDDVTKKNGELYIRGESSHFPDPNKKKFYKKEMEYGVRAHLGANANNFERGGDQYNKSLPVLKVQPKTSLGSAELYNDILIFKKDICLQVAEELKNLKNTRIGFYNDYPCVMVNIRKSAKQTDMSNDAYKAWVNFLMSLYVGIVNYHAVKNDLKIELVRRSSFGFNSPTVACVGDAFRINTGIIPRDYVDIMIKGLQELDTLVKDIYGNKTNKPAVAGTLFYGSKAHRVYLTKDKKQVYPTPKLDNAFQLLWQKVEKEGKTTTQNLMRTAFCRDGISAKMYKKLKSNNGDVMKAASSALEWALKRLSIVKIANKNTLSFDKSGSVRYGSVRSSNEEKKVDDKKYWNMIGKINDAYIKCYKHDPHVNQVAKSVKSKIKNRTIESLYAHLEVLNEYVLANEISKMKPAENAVEDGYGSDSDCEYGEDDDRIYSKKVIVSNGMRAILATLLAISHESKSFSLYSDAMYYEVKPALALLKKFDDKEITLCKPKNISDASAYLYDINACVTTAIAAKKSLEVFLKETKNKILILDTTSATTDQAAKYIDTFKHSRASCLFFVSSGLKHEQMAADRNAYGTIRIFAKEKQVSDRYYQRIKQQEPNVDSPFSHQYRRAMKKLGAVPTSTSYLSSLRR